MLAIELFDRAMDTTLREYAQSLRPPYLSKQASLRNHSNR